MRWFASFRIVHLWISAICLRSSRTGHGGVWDVVVERGRERKIECLFLHLIVYVGSQRCYTELRED